MFTYIHTHTHRKTYIQITTGLLLDYDNYNNDLMFFVFFDIRFAFLCYSYFVSFSYHKIPMNSSFIPSTRTAYIYQTTLVLSTEQTIKKKRKLHQAKNYEEKKELCSTTKSLARTFINVTDRYQKNKNDKELAASLMYLAKQICICKRSLQFSTIEFINTWLNHMISAKITTNELVSPLLVYHALTRYTCYLTLEPLIIFAEIKWLINQCDELLLSPSWINVYQGKYEIRGWSFLLDENQGMSLLTYLINPDAIIRLC